MGGKILSKMEVLERFSRVHGDKYDYSNISYINMNTPINIVCHEHNNTFTMTPTNHIAGQRCNICSNRFKWTVERFHKEVVAIHVDELGVLIIDKSNKTIVEAFCEAHGMFKVNINNHIIQKQGCPKCSKSCKDDVYTFTKKAKIVHGEKYDYSEVDYVNSTTKVSIICPKHRIFKQTPSDHLQGRGCSKCSKHISKGELELLEFIESCLIEKYGSLPGIITNKLPDFFPNKQHLDVPIPSLNLAF